MPSISSARPLAGTVSKIGSYAAAAVLLGVLVLGVVISPVAFSAVGKADRDWGRLSTIGQAYGSVSALLSAAALCLVVLLQRRQVRHERLTLVRDMHLTVVGTALDNPEYCQCWGARMTDDDTPEGLYYYTNAILTLWWYAFEAGDLRDEQVRNYALGMFDSEVPRNYWRAHGQWRLDGARGRRRRRFLALVDEAFREAEAGGPPARPRERAGRNTRPDGARRALRRSALTGSRRRLR